MRIDCVKQLGKFKINLVCIIISIFAGYDLQTTSVTVFDDNILMHVCFSEQFD